MVAILPLLLYPALGLGMLQMTLIFSEQPRQVVLLGENDLPEPALIKGNRFDPRWFEVPSEADKLEVITEGFVFPTPKEGESAPPVDEAKKEMLEKANGIRGHLELIIQHEADVRKLVNKIIDQTAEIEEKAAAKNKESEESVNEEEIEKLISTDTKILKWRESIHEFQVQIRGERAEVSRLFSRCGFQVLIVIPKGFGKRIREENEKLTNRAAGLANAADYPRPIILKNSADEKSMIAHGRVREAMRRWEQTILAQRLENADLPSTLPRPVNSSQVDIAESEQIAANVWSKLFPALLVIMSLTGAFYPAVDLAAGEKERGTMETLLICPASRGEIVLGKFFTVLLFSIGTALLNLLSMGLTGQHMLAQAGGGAASGMGDFTLPGIGPMLWVLLLAFPLGALFSALSLALAIFAKSSKEGQYYLSPLLLITMGLTVFCLSPAAEITPFYSIMPVMGPALLLKSLLSAGPVVPGLLGYAVPVLVSSLGYSFLALWWAVEQFRREDILFRESEQFNIRLWLRQLWRERGSVPTFGQGVFCFVFIMFMQFITMQLMGDLFKGAQGESQDVVKAQLLIASQVFIIAGPALLMGFFLTTNFRKTFRLHFPPVSYLLFAPLLALLIHPLLIEWSAAMSPFFPQLPDHVAESLRNLMQSDLPLWGRILLVSLTPAICEELAFRGYILSGLSRSGRYGIAIVISSLLFGIIHMVPQQVFNATLLGMVIGLLAIKSNSLLPCLLFHFTNNALAVLHAQTEHWSTIPSSFAFFASPSAGNGLRYESPTLLIAGIGAAILLVWLFQQSIPGNISEEEAEAEGVVAGGDA